MYLANFPGLGRGLDFLLILFLHQGKKRRIEVGIYPIERAYYRQLIAKRITFQTSI